MQHIGPPPPCRVATPAELTPKPGDLVLVKLDAERMDGVIQMQEPGHCLTTGQIWVTEEQAKKAEKYGWRIVSPVRKSIDRSDLVKIERG